MKISELQPRMGNVNIEAEVVEKGDVREFTKFGKVGRVCNAVVKDDSGKVKLTLWNDDVDKVNVGDKVKLSSGYVNEYQGEMQLTTGRAGKLEVTGSGESDPADSPAEEKAPAQSELDIEEEDI
jgi:replication factor A1